MVLFLKRQIPQNKNTFEISPIIPYPTAKAILGADVGVDKK